MTGKPTLTKHGQTIPQPRDYALEVKEWKRNGTQPIGVINNLDVELCFAELPPTQTGRSTQWCYKARGHQGRCHYNAVNARATRTDA